MDKAILEDIRKNPEEFINMMLSKAVLDEAKDLTVSELIASYSFYKFLKYMEEKNKS